MDLETENRLAALLMEEARRLRAEADREGVHVYLRQSNVRGRPNSRFLTATVLGVQQANRVVEVNEMWRAREKELELDAKPKNRGKDKDSHYVEKHHSDSRRKASVPKNEERACRNSASSSKRRHEDDACGSSDDGGLRDDELEEFLRSRAKRGRGEIGSRMDEPGPYPTSMSINHDGNHLRADPDAREKEEWERCILGPAKPSFMKSSSHDSFREEHHSDGSKRKHNLEERKKRKRSSKEEKRERKRKKKSKHSRHHKTRRRSDSE